MSVQLVFICSLHAGVGSWKETADSPVFFRPKKSMLFTEWRRSWWVVSSVNIGWRLNTSTRGATLWCVCVCVFLTPATSVPFLCPSWNLPLWPCVEMTLVLLPGAVLVAAAWQTLWLAWTSDVPLDRKIHRLRKKHAGRKFQKIFLLSCLSFRRLFNKCLQVGHWMTGPSLLLPSSSLVQQHRERWPCFNLWTSACL